MKKCEFVSLVLAIVLGVVLGLWYKTLNGIGENVDFRTIAIFLNRTGVSRESLTVLAIFNRFFETAHYLLKETNKEELIVRLLFFTSAFVLLQSLILIQIVVATISETILCVVIGICVVISAMSGTVTYLAWKCKKK